MLLVCVCGVSACTADFIEFCCCKSFHHVATKLFLYGTEEQKGRLVNKLASRREAALTKVR